LGIFINNKDYTLGTRSTNGRSSSGRYKTTTTATTIIPCIWAARNEDVPTDRLWGTRSLANKYKKDTPGQEKTIEEKEVELHKDVYKKLRNFKRHVNDYYTKQQHDKLTSVEKPAHDVQMKIHAPHGV